MKARISWPSIPRSASTARSASRSARSRRSSSEDDLPEDQADFLQLNAELAAEWPVITEVKKPPEDADEWADKPNKRELLER